MKYFLLSVLALLLGTNLLNAQKLKSGDYHNHRRSLKNSFLKFQNEKEGRVAF